MISYVLGATTSGPMIMCRWDSNGVANEIMQLGSHEQQEINHVLMLLHSLKKRFSRFDVIDGGANIGTWTIQLAKAIKGVGNVFSFEPQRALFYPLAGNVALNNCLNAYPRMAALSDRTGDIAVTQFPMGQPQPMSTLQLENLPGGSFAREYVPSVTIDSLGLNLKLIKLDVEGMEPKALQGAKQTIERCRPAVFAEVFQHSKGHLLQYLPNYTEKPLPDPRNSIFWPAELGDYR